MNQALNRIITGIGEAHRHHITRDKARNYLEVNIGKAADEMGIEGLSERLRAADVIVPLSGPVSGMKVRIDGRTFVNYARFDSGVAVPGYVAREAGLPSTAYGAEGSMILNFTGAA